MKKKGSTTSPFKDHFSMMRTLVLADFVTLANGCSGACILLFCLQHLADPSESKYLSLSFFFIPLAVAFDVLDGLVARYRHQQSILGADLDSLADLISFGVAPAVLGFTMGLRGLYDCMILLYYICCTMSRLARYNAERLQMTNKKTGKVKGFPAPFGCMIVVFFLALAYFGHSIVPTAIFHQLFSEKSKFLFFDFHPFSALYFFVGCGMISSSIKVPKL